MNFKRLTQAYNKYFNIYNRDCFLYPWIFVGNSFIGIDQGLGSPLGEARLSYNMIARKKNPSVWYGKIYPEDRWNVIIDTIRQVLCSLYGHKKVGAFPLNIDAYRNLQFENSDAPYICGTIDSSTVTLLCKRCKLFLSPLPRQAAGTAQKVFVPHRWRLIKEVFVWMKLPNLIGKT